MKKKPKKHAVGEQLFITEKKVGIRKMRLEIENEKLKLREIEPRRIAVDEQYIVVQKISELRCLLSDVTINEEKTIFGSEPIYKSILDEEERKMVKIKLRELIKKF